MIKTILKEDLSTALSLVNRVFAEFVAVDYSDEGNATFSNYLKTKDAEWGRELSDGKKKMWGYYADGTLAGVIATRDVTHISLMFVDKAHHKKGIARQMFEVVKEDILAGCDADYITVNSSPYAAPVYERLGFTPTDTEQENNGIRYVPMQCKLKRNCIIRPWCIEDAPDLAAAINNKKVQDNLRDGIPFPYTIKDGEEFISAMLATDKDKVFPFAIETGGKVVGSIGVFRKDNVHRCTAEMGYFVAEQYWGKGICTEAVQKACRYVFEHTDIIRIFAEPYAYNDASCRVLEKAGFSYEGTLIKNAIKNGKVMNMKMYAMIRDDEPEV